MRLAFVGDIALGDHPKTVGFGFRSSYPEGVSAALATRLRPPGPVPDVVFGNLEFCLGGTTADSSSLDTRQCRGLDQYVELLITAGVSVLNVANNHCAQHGHRAFWTTVELLRAHGIMVVGTPADFDGGSLIEVCDRRIAFLGWSAHPRQHAADEPPYNEFGAHAYDLIRDARRTADVVVVSVHWGEEFVQVPSEQERHIARSMIEAGASIVVGHHPHVLREVEHHAQGVVAYSLGNFVGDMTWNPATRIGGCLLVDLGDDVIDCHRLALSRIDPDYLPTFLPDEDAAAVVRRLEGERRRQSEQIALRGYDAVVDAEHRKHVRATALMMIRNLHRYSPGILRPMVAGAVHGRIRVALS